jgi:hypothetical protein
MKTTEQKQAEVLNYFDKTSQHLFVTKQGVIFKIITHKHEDKLYYSKLVINKDKFTIETREAFKYGMGLKQSWKHSFFPDYLEIKSIKHFKKFRTIENNLFGSLTTDNTKNQEVLDKLVTGYKFFEIETK